ncbi:similar to Saccharomyces cerevisiae YIL051C MMF1 Mitochondrial protein required for transamination of isoleucine but not of valine or leucine [Maudiozyma saulgeensis]|uniref:Similar to Saccharomyces cerevisiae YIL051C MMF1 Mitochondrial protein required for transamination of isoleucine but not of valine or leucine n=1 Tax=Maudiozyma saulgeensis TaxID=1789683 RepID=A0A1X7R2P2_9SACH|nr:similar to Saccharomyces cerevisiae YIL051C MMF1 Mitochondrial protein required for transamination of isoleucine but not of valine or leucine [Kazachstania saulgeensis]
MAVKLTPINASNAPAPAAPYSHAMKAGDFIYLSGQVALTPDNKQLGGPIGQRATQIFENIKTVLADCNSSLERIVKVNIFLTDINDFAEFNKVYGSYFNTHKPARSCVAVAALPLGETVEVEVVAVENE